MAEIELLRRQQAPCWRIAAQIGTSPATVARRCRALGLSRITGDRTGQSNNRGTGWEYLHLAVDDHSRLAYSEILPDEKRRSCLTFLFNALRFFRSHDARGSATDP
jgi:hypothetical protein